MSEDTKMTAVQVRILDKDYRVNCPASDQDALLKAAHYLDQNMRQIKERGSILGTEKVAVMAALNITHEMFKKNHSINEVRDLTSREVRNLEDKVDLALAASRQFEI